MRNYILIDGNFFAHRTIHGIRISQPEFNLSTEQERRNFLVALNNGFLNLFSSFNNEFYNLIDNFVFVFDCNSWRKEVVPHRPYYIDELESTSIDYKGNRTALKNDSDIDFDAFDLVVTQFYEGIKEHVVSFRINGCEGDDALLLLQAKLKEKKIFSWIFCTDGDLKQIVNNNCALLKNSKSKEKPNGEIILSKTMYNKVFGAQSAMEKMTQLQDNLTLYKQIINYSLNSGQSRSNIVRNPQNNSVDIADPILTVLEKIICGDSKDNIFPLFRWINSTGTRNMKVTPKMIAKVWSAKDMEYSEKSAFDTLNNKEELIHLLSELMILTKQGSKVSMKSIGTHFNHNLKMLTLTEDILPAEVKANFQIFFNSVEDRLMVDLTRENLLQLNLNTTMDDNAKDLIVSSVPTIKDNTGSQETYASNSDLVNNILNF